MNDSIAPAVPPTSRETKGLSTDFPFEELDADIDQKVYYCQWCASLGFTEVEVNILSTNRLYYTLSCFYRRQ